MKYRAYCFPDESVAETLIAAGGFLDLDMIGQTFNETAEGEEPSPIPGIFANVVWGAEELSSWAPYQISAEASPRWWSGVPRSDPAPLATPVPPKVTNFQARAVMRATFLPGGQSLETAVGQDLLAARAATAELPESHPLRTAADQNWLAWEQSNEFYRHSTLVETLAAARGLSAEAVDELFRTASGVEA